MEQNHFIKTKPAIAKSRIGWNLLAVAWLLAAPFAFSEDAPWHLTAADLRFEMSISHRPTDPAAGIIAIVPDAGILPRSKFKPEVIDATGKTLKSETLWHNPHEGLAIVFEPTEANTVFLYILPSAEGLKFVSSFRPSLLLYVKNGHAGLEQAHALADNAPVGDNIFFAVVDRICHSVLPVGHDENTSSYYRGWFTSPRPGKTYFYTVSKDGSEFFIDGKLIHSWPGRHNRDGGKSGEHGNWVNITPGPHKVDYFHFSVEYSMRESQLGWQLPGTQPRDDPNVPGKKKLAVSPMEDFDFVHSGMATLIRAVCRKGPLAIFSSTWESFINPYKEPVLLFRFHTFGFDTHPPGTTYEWDFGHHRKVNGTNAVWLFAGVNDQKVTLTVSAGQYASKSTRIIFPKSTSVDDAPPMLSITNANTRRLYSDVFLGMCQAVPSGQRPCESWSESLWKGFIATLDPNSPNALLGDIFERSRPDMMKLNTPLRWSLEDKFLDALSQTNHPATLSWLDRFEKEEQDAARIGHWKAARIECYLYDINDLKKARSAAIQFMDSVSGAVQPVLAMIRMGDVERLSRNVEEARRLYALAQETRQRVAQTARPAMSVSASAATPAPPPKVADKASSTNKLSAPTAIARFTRPPREAALWDNIKDWKIAAVREAAFYSTVQSFLQQQAFIEAKQTLDQWEMELPLSKLSGDYPLAEARYYMALKNYRRALSILSNYRESVDLSNYLPDAMKLEFRCLVLMGQDDTARGLARLIIKRLPNHPLAEEAKAQLSPENMGKLTIEPEDEPKAWTSTEKVKSGTLADLFSSNKVIYVETTPEENATPAESRASEEAPK